MIWCGIHATSTYLFGFGGAADLDALCGPSDGHHDFAGGSAGAGRGEEHGDDEDLHDDVARVVGLTVLGEDVLRTDAMLTRE